MIYSIVREKQLSENNNYIVVVKKFVNHRDALDALYYEARRYGYIVTVDNEADYRFGFCLWQIQVKVGDWTYSIVQDDWVGISDLSDKVAETGSWLPCCRHISL